MTSQGENYIRVKAAKYFLFDFSPSYFNTVFGNGTPYSGKTEYGVFSEYLNKKRGFYLSDLGLIGFYAMFGVLSILGYIMIWTKAFQIRLPDKYRYLKYYLWFLLISGFTSDTVYGYNYLITTVFVLYCYQKVYEDERTISMVKKQFSYLHAEAVK